MHGHRRCRIRFRTYGSLPTTSAFLTHGEFRMKHLMFTIAASGAAMIVAFAAGAPAIRHASAAAAEKTATQEFKNVRVLKDIPADELIPTMQFISASLGVDCEFC